MKSSEPIAKIYVCPVCMRKKEKQNSGKNMRGEDICVLCGSLFTEYVVGAESRKKHTANKATKAKSTKRLAKFVGGQLMNTTICRQSRDKEKFLWIVIWILFILALTAILLFISLIILR